MRLWRVLVSGVCITGLFFGSCAKQTSLMDDLYSYAKSRQADLKLSVYITAQSVADQLNDESGRRAGVSLLKSLGITKVYLEVYRGGLVIEQALLAQVKAEFERQGIEVAGGIATVPGDDFGMRQEAQLEWFNWQNPKTQQDLLRVMQMVPKVYDEFIVDDFLCTADTSEESKRAKGEQSWSQYRRDLLTRLSKELFIDPIKAVNPKATVIIKYPQWYDRFHLFGYDVVREPQHFDKIWVGTETRGAKTQRYGFVQPYEGFVNFRWLSSIAGEKTGGAWFDHGDCNANDFIEQAYQSVLAGAREIILFSYGDLVRGHGGHHLLRRQFGQLADLAKEVRQHPVTGAFGYKPPHSDAGGDLYIMDFIGMLGVPLVPCSQFPDEAKVLFLPTQAAKDENLVNKIDAAVQSGKTIILTAGLLTQVPNQEKLLSFAGVSHPIRKTGLRAEQVLNEGMLIPVPHGLDLEAEMSLTTAKALLQAKVGNRTVPFFTVNQVGSAPVYVLNNHTFSQQDFDAVGEVLLAPRALGLLDLPRKWANTLRNAFNAPLGITLDAPTRVAFQPLGDAGWVVHNYNDEPAEVSFSLASGFNKEMVDGFTGKSVAGKEKLVLEMEPRSRIWLRYQSAL